jgi:uncharacterized protein (TIGR02265 family)
MRELFPDESSSGAEMLEPTQSTGHSGEALVPPTSGEMHQVPEQAPAPKVPEKASGKKTVPLPRATRDPREPHTGNVTANPQELGLRIKSCMPGDTVHGFFFNALFGLTMRLVGTGSDGQLRGALEEKKSFVDALTYPTPEFLRVMWKAVELIGPRVDGVDAAFRDMGVWSMDGLLRSPLGRPVEQFKGRAPHEILKPLVATLKPMLTPGERVVGPFTGRGGSLIFKGEVLPIQFHAGLVTAALERLCSLQPTVKWEKTAADRVEMALSW